MSREQLIQTIWGENRGKVVLLLSLILLIGAMQLWQGLWLEPELGAGRLLLRNAQADLRLEQQRVSAGGGAKITGLADDLETFYQRVPPRKGLGSFIGRIYSYANDAGIEIDQISYASKSVKQTDLLGYQLSFSVAGSYTQLKKFIHRLENSPSLLILQQISLGGSSKGNEDLVKLRIRLQTFFREGKQ